MRFSKTLDDVTLEAIAIQVGSLYQSVASESGKFLQETELAETFRFGFWALMI